MNKEEFVKELGRIPDLPTLPVVAVKVNEMLQDRDVSIGTLSETIQKDQAMVSKILKLVNSAFYGFQSKIRTIPHAITILGFNTVRNAIVSVGVVGAFANRNLFDGFDIKDFWTHSISTAVVGKHLAEKSRLTSPDAVFVAGILHDIGKLVLAQYFTDLFAALWQEIHDKGVTFHEAEKVVLPARHAQIGGWLAKKWKLPPSLLGAITYHHGTGKTAFDPDLVLLVHSSDHIVNRYDGSNGNGFDVSGMNPEGRRKLRKELDDLPQWYPQAAEEIEQACEFFVDS